MSQVQLVDKSISPEMLLNAYAQGVFPMADDGEILWFSPEKRGVIPVDERFHINHGLKRALKKQPFELAMDRDFIGVMQGCAERKETWIDERIVASYVRLHQLGFAHSVECWDEDGLQGGLYGVRLGNAFFGESMFSRKSNASKIALVWLVEWMRSEQMTLLDTQWLTTHLQTFGGYEVEREEYMVMLEDAIEPFLKKYT